VTSSMACTAIWVIHSVPQVRYLAAIAERKLHTVELGRAVAAPEAQSRSGPPVKQAPSRWLEFFSTTSTSPPLEISLTRCPRTEGPRRDGPHCSGCEGTPALSSL